MIVRTDVTYIEGIGVVCGSVFTNKGADTISTTENGATPKYAFVLTGEGRAVSPDGTIVIEFSNDAVMDMSALADYPFYVTECYSNSGFGVNINPVPYTNDITCELLKGPTTKTVTGTSVQSAVISVKGDIAANDKTLAAFKFARIPEGKTVDISVPEGSIGFYLSRTSA